jgi:hypothetical protein
MEGDLAPFLKEANINCVVNLAVSDRDLRAETRDVKREDRAFWYKWLVERTQAVGLNMNQFNIPSPDFNKRLARGLRFMIAVKGPYLIHCFAGVDRTGFVCAMLEAFMGASFDEVMNDYLASFESYGTTSIYKGNDRTNPRVMLEQLGKIAPGITLKGPETKDNELNIAAQEYLLSDLGLSPDECQALMARLEGR